MTTDGFVRRARRKQPRSPGGDLALQAPPEIPRAVPANILLRILPVVMVVAMIGMIALFISVGGSAAMRNPMMMMFPMMMLMSMAGMFFGGGRGNGKRAAELNEERKDYLRYLGRMRDDVATTTSDQHDALAWSHPEPEGLLPAIGGDRMWERRPDDSDFCHVRVGVGSQRLATRLSPPDTGPLEDLEPVSMMALRRFIRAHTVTRGMPTAVSLRGFAAIGIEGATDRVHGLVRAMLVQIATMHGPDHVRIAVICADPDAEAWSWLKWVPHALHPTRTDGIGAARMMYRSLGEFDQDHHSDLMERGRWARSAPPTQGRVQWVVVLADGYVAGNEPVISDGGLDSVTVIDVRGAAYELTARKGLQLEIRDTGLLAARTATDSEEFAVADNVSVGLAETIARRMARFRLATAAQLVNLSTTDTENADPGLMRLIGAGDAARIDPSVVWRPRSARERLRVPIGIRRDGSPMELDIKEAAEYGMGPHGLCIGATGSGKSEFLRTLVLSMVTTHSPDALNLVLVDFKGGATFLGLDELPHVAAVITNLEEELSMVDRMRDALAGEMNRRQELLRSAGNFANVGDYEAARRNGADLDPLPALFIVVDEFSELLSQKPDFAELFVMIGRLGRSLHVHLLLASQRLEEGKLRGLDSHLSYRIGLKTFSAAESRAVLGVPDAYHLPSQPGSAFLKSDADDPVRFNASYVSGPYIPGVVEAGGDDGGRASLGGGSLKLFTASPVEADAVPEPTETPAITRASSSTEPLIRDGRTVTLLDMVVSRLVGHGRPAHEVWLPPLDESPAVNSLFPGDDWRSSAFARGSLVVPIGIEDRPYDQRRDVLTVDVSGAAGHVAVVGGPQSGKSTTVRTFILSTAATHTPAEAQFYCLDFGGGTLTGLAGLAHVGSVATRMEDDRVRRTVAEVVTLLRQREARFRDLGIESIRDFRRRKALALAADSDDPILEDEFGDVFLVVDGWGVVRSEFEALEEQLTAVAGQGLSYGIHLVLTASRWMEIRPAVKDLLGTRLELRLGDPGDSEFDRKVAHLVPSGRPGRGLTPDNLHMLVGLPRLDGETDPNTLQDGVADAITQIAAFYGDLAAPAVRMLPERVDRDELSARAWQMHEKNPTSVALGINESELAPVVIDFLAQPHVLAFGDTESGKTALLRTILRGLVENSTPSQTKIVLIDYRRTLLGEVEGNHLAGYASQASTTQTLMTDLAAVLDSRQPGADITPKELRDRSWWEGPEFYVVIDDYDMVALASGNPILPIVDYLAQARDVGLHVILVRRSGGASRALYDPVITRLRDVSAEGLVMSGNKDEGVLLGTTKCCPRPPGQAMMVSRTQGEGLVQIAWTPPREI